MVRLKRDNLIFALLFVAFSCNNKFNDGLIIDELKGYGHKYFRKYKDTYTAVNDTLKIWLRDSIMSTRMANYFPYQIDSVFIFNRDSTRIFTTINFSSSTLKNDIADMICEFGGAKIHGKWYFFFGANMVVPREMFGDKVYEPLSFERLSEVAHQQMHSKFWRQDSTGKYAPNERLFDKDLCPLPYGSWEGKPKNVVDSMVVLECAERRQKKLDPKEIARIKAEMAASRKPLEPRRKWFGFGGYMKEDLDNPRYE